MSRRTHLVGAWPGYSAPHAMDVAFTRLGPWLDRLSDGEVGLRSLWVTPVVEGMRANPNVEMTQDGDYTSYERTPKFKLKEGAQLDPGTIELGFRRAFEASYPQFKELRARHGRDDVRFQVGVPSPIDLALVCFGPEGFANPALAGAFLQAEVRELSEIAALADPEDVVFQLETIVAIPAAATEATPDQHQMQGDAGAMIDRVAQLFAAVAAGTPPKAHFGMHLCLGDFNHVAFSHMPDAEPIVRVVNAVVAHWPEDHPLDYVHVPFAAAAEPPSLEADFYAPLAGLELPPDVRLAAGFVHEHLDETGHDQLLTLIESAAGREVDIAATCGLGRRPTLEEAWDAMNKSRTLLEAHG
ncbi:MAG: hypothetical protein V7607_608 [Solirubrobacteraceae bacterium]